MVQYRLPIILKKLDRLCKLTNSRPENSEIRRNLYNTKREYKKLTKSLKSEFEKMNIQKMENSAVNQINDFWKIFKKIRNPDKDDEIPSQSKLQKFFEKLYSDDPDNGECQSTIIQPIRSKISTKITDEEIENHVQRLKKKKAAGSDDVINEMIIFADKIALDIIKMIFNRIIETEEYPEKWNTSLTQLIYKDGDRDDPGNYRGIALTSNLSKLFNSIINTRLYAYIEENNILRPEQGGFRKGYRTIDHIFTLLTIVTKHLSKGKKLYACFVDLKKAYDSVWRNGLFFKLKQLGLDKKTTNIIENMYKQTSTSIIRKNQILPKIAVTKGLKQGDNLSPILFNIYINDLPEFISLLRDFNNASKIYRNIVKGGN